MFFNVPPAKFKGPGKPSKQPTNYDGVGHKDNSNLESLKKVLVKGGLAESCANDLLRYEVGNISLDTAEKLYDELYSKLKDLKKLVE